MCDADVSVITYQWFPQTERLVPNFNNPRKCRDYGAVLQWAKEHQASAPTSHTNESSVDGLEAIIERLKAGLGS